MSGPHSPHGEECPPKRPPSSCPTLYKGPARTGPTLPPEGAGRDGLRWRGSEEKEKITPVGVGLSLPSGPSHHTPPFPSQEHHHGTCRRLDLVRSLVDSGLLRGRRHESFDNLNRRRNLHSGTPTLAHVHTQPMGSGRSDPEKGRTLACPASRVRNARVNDLKTVRFLNNSGAKFG